MRWRTPHAPRRVDVPKPPQRRSAAGFALTVLGSAGFAWAFVVDADVWWQGVTLGVALLGLAYGFAAWEALLPTGPFVEQRESMRPPKAEQDALAEDLGRADGAIVSSPVPRRALTAALVSVGLVALLPLRSLIGVSPQPGRALRRSAWGDGVPVVTEDGLPVRPGDLVVGSALTVFPRGHTTEGDVGVLLLRVPEEELQLPPERLAWTVRGVVGYSKICTHAGCPVGLYAEGTGQLLCPCHQSVFDVYRGAQPRYGPAARPLPQLPLGLAPDGTLMARGDFPTPPGPGFWRTE